MHNSVYDVHGQQKPATLNTQGLMAFQKTKKRL